MSGPGRVQPEIAIGSASATSTAGNGHFQADRDCQCVTVAVCAGEVTVLEDLTSIFFKLIFSTVLRLPVVRKTEK